FISGGFDRAAVGTNIMHCQAVALYDGTTIDTLSGGPPGEEAEALAMYNGLLYAGGGPTNTSSYIANYNLSTGVSELKQENKSIKTISLKKNNMKKLITLIAIVCILDLVNGQTITNQQLHFKTFHPSQEKSINDTLMYMPMMGGYINSIDSAGFYSYFEDDD